jgi:hypothetical protein
VAVTAQVYAVPFVSPKTVIGLADAAAIIAPGLHVVLYVVIADPPVATGVAKLTATDLFPAVAVAAVGAAGGVARERALGSGRPPLLVGVRLTGPTALGVRVNDCAAAELLNVSTRAPENPPPDTVMVTVPL